jgi:hypothetical protein
MCISKTENETPGMALKSKLERQSRDLTQFTELVDRLRSSSDAEALAIIRRLKSTPNVAVVLSSIRNTVPPRRPSDIQTARGILPPTHSQLELELTILHRKVYPLLEPLNTSVIDLGLDPPVNSFFQSHWPPDYRWLVMDTSQNRHMVAGLLAPSFCLLAHSRLATTSE